VREQLVETTGDLNRVDRIVEVGAPVMLGFTALRVSVL
jgi:hypothetical protein